MSVLNLPIVEPVGKENIATYIKLQATLNGIDPEMAVAVSNCESGLNPKIVGDHGNSRGLWQFHRPSWPDITDEQAFSVTWSTGKAMQLMREGKYNLWTCYRTLYGNRSS